MASQLLHSAGSIGDAIANFVADRLGEAEPAPRAGANREQLLRDARVHAAYLLEAVEQQRAEIFVAYVSWAKTVWRGRGAPTGRLAAEILALREAAERFARGEVGQRAVAMVDLALERLPKLQDTPRSEIMEGNPLRALARSYLNCLLERRRDDAVRMVRDAVENAVPVKDVYLHVFQPVLREIGRLWQIGGISVAEEHYATAATQMVMSQLYPQIASLSRSGRTLVAACAGDDLHELGIRMVADFMEMEGWDTVYLGANLPADAVVDMVLRTGATALGLSATLPFHVRRMREIVSALRALPAANGTYILVGGYAFGEGGGDWRMTGADGYAADAAAAVALLSDTMP